MTRRPRQTEVINMLFALPLDVRQWIEAKAALNLSPMNSVVITTLRAAMNAEQRQEKATR